MNKENDYQLLMRKLDEFIRKYHKNLIIKGSIYFLAYLLITFLCINSLEYFLFLNPIVKSSLWILLLILTIYLKYIWIIKNSLNYFNLSKSIDHKKAALLIGEHFSDIKDKLLNTLELHELVNHSEENQSLINASINQKIQGLNPITFSKAVDLSKNKKYLKYAAYPLALLIIIIIAAPGFIKQGSSRLMNYSTQYIKPAPFQFNLLNKNLSFVQGEDVQIELKMTGNEIPQDIYLHIGEANYKLEKKSISEFEYTLSNVQKSQNIYFSAGGFSSTEYIINVTPNPSILKFNIELNYPAYLNKQSEKITNIGDLSLPQGTQVKWNFYSENCNSIDFNWFDKKEKLIVSDNKSSITKKIMRTGNYGLRAYNNSTAALDTLSYSIQAIPDLFPQINLEQKQDSISNKIIYFSGAIKDDYGISKLMFHFVSNSETNSKKQSVNIPIRKGSTNDRFFYYWNLNEFEINLGESIDYYFEVWDNDGVNGPKSSKSATMNFKSPTEGEISKKVEKNNSSLKQKMSEAIRQSEQIQKEAKRLNEKLLNKKNLSFEEKKQVNDLINKQEQLEEQVKDIQKQNESNNQFDKDFKKTDPQILEKKKQLDELFENILDDKTKAMIKELEKMLEQNNKEKTQEEIQKMQMDNKDLSKEMDRMLELFKQLELEQKINENIDKLDQLADDQKKLSEESKDKNADAKKLQEEQNKLNKELQYLQTEMKDIEKKNEELEDKQSFDNPEEELKDIQNDMQKSSDELGDQKKQKASQSQKSAAEKMKALAEKMKKSQSDGEGEELELNMRALRQILDNLLTVSFDQETVMEKFKKTNTNDPQYVTATQTQRNLKDDMKMIEDSLYALSKKVLQIKSIINKETGKINQNMDQSIGALAERKTSEAIMRQQYAMTSINNLAVLLSEILDQMQQEMQSKKENSKPGSKPSKKPGGKGKGDTLSKMQNQLNKQMEQMKNGMKPGEKPGKGQMSEQLAKMAAQQQAIRSAMDQLEKEMNQNGQGGNGKEINQLKKEMEKTETELYNKNISQQTIDRQKEIMSRLLEAEKAVRERENDNKRESKSGQEQYDKPKLAFEEYKKQKMKELELLKTVPPTLSPYYKEKVNSYFDKISDPK